MIPKTVGSCVDMMVMLADVTKADMGMYGMNSIINPRRRMPKPKMIAPARKLSARAISSARYTPGCVAWILLTALPIRREPTAVVYCRVS